MKKFYSILMLVLFLSLNATGQVTGDFRSKATGPGNWNDFNAWERYDGATWLAAISGQLPLATCAVEIQAGHTLIINATGLICGNLTINGSLTYIGTLASTLTISGNVIVSASGSFTSPSSGTVITHALNIGGSTATGVGGNLVVDGFFNMNSFSTAGVIVTFYGTPSNTVSGIGSTINFYSLVVNKGTSNTSILDVTSVITCADATSTAGLRLSVIAGTFKLSSPSILKPYFGTVQATAPNIARLWMNNASAVVQSVGAGTSGGSTGTLSFGGLLQIDAGTLAYGNGTSSISIFGNFLMGGANANLNVYGYFYSGNASTYTITAGNINIYPQLGANYVASIFFSQMGLFHFGGTALNFTGGTLTIVEANLAVTSGSYYAPYSINITAGTNNLAGSTIRFGDGISDLDGSVNGFTINSGTALGHVIVNNLPSSVKTTRYVKMMSNLTIGGNLTINSGVTNQFFLNGFMLTTRGNINNSGTFTFNVVAPGNTTSGLTFTGTAQQTVGGAGTFSNNVNNLVINNTSGASPAVDIQFPLSVSNSLTLTKGLIGSTTGSVFNIGKTGYTTFSLIRSGGSIASPPTFALGGVTTFNVTYSGPSPASNTTSGFELPASTPITTFTVNNTSGVTLDKAVSCTTLTLTSGILTTTSTNSITVTGTAITNITGGSATAYVNGPLTRALPNTAVAANYKFPVGKTAYQLFEYSSITSGGTGTANFTVEAFDNGPYAGAAGTGLSSINTNKYWSLSAVLGSVTITSSTVRLTDAGLVSTNKMGQSNNTIGTYNSLGALVTGGTTIASVSPLDYSAIGTGTYFRVGFASAFTAGIYAIGPQALYAGYSGTFPSIGSAVVAITSVPLPGSVIFEFQGDYNPVVETFPISMNSNIASNATSTITFRPSPSVGAVINFSAVGSVLINAGADYVTFDGRNGGTGTNKFLQFTNTITAGSTITLSTDAQYNQILYCLLKGSTITASTGILTINGATIGNNFYTIDNCNFDASGMANNCIYATGIGSNATIVNNNFFDYRNGAGINLPSGSNNGVIDNNNFYQTTLYSGFAGTTYGIFATGGNNCRISNNNIGGSGPAIIGTWTVSPTTPAAYNFTGISASLGTTSKIYGNRIQNFDWKSTPATWTGINGSGTVNIGGDGANFIGSSTGNDNIKITYFNTNGAAVVNGITISGTSVTVANNNIGSITTLLSGATGIGSSINGILNNATSAVISNNVIGSATTPQSINAANQSTTGNAQNIYGVNCPSIGSVTITGNIFANWYNGMTFTSASAGMMRGIRIPNTGSGIAISSNNFFSFSTPQPMTGAISAGSSAHSIVAIDLNATNAANTNVTGNTIYDLTNTAATGAVSVLGIYCQSGANSVFDRNYIHSLSTVSNTAVQTGINLNYGGPCTIKNNIIRLGLDYAGNSITSNAQINGIIKNSGNGFPCYAYFNTVYIGGSGVTAGSAATYCFFVTLHVTEDLKDNIFVNARSGGGTNYAIRVNATGIAPSGLTLNYNDYFVNGTGSMFGYYNGNIADLAVWKTAVGLDANSIGVDPQFASTANLVPLNLALSAGTPIAGITTDFAGTIRNAITPTIGAYEGSCVNPTIGGTIASDQNNCGSFDPVLISSTILPGGYVGTLEYKWQSSITPFSTWTDIPINTDTYDPLPILETNMYKRLARVTCKSDWVGAAGSNVLIMTVNPIPSAPAVGTITHPTCALSTGSVILNSLPAGNWTINPGAIPGTGLTTTISDLTQGTYNFMVTSNAGCTSTASIDVVINPQPIPAITVTSPNGGENWETSTTQNITWNSSCIVGNVHIEFSTNNGTNWSDVIASTINNGSYSWTIPNIASINCLVKVSDLDGSPTDQCDAVFVIFKRHFNPAWSGNGIDHMNFYVLTATLDGVDLQPDDEIGIFDGNTCVGTGRLNAVLVNGATFLSIAVSKDDPATPEIDGYTPGNSATFKLWDNSTQTEISYVTATYTSGTAIFEVGGSSSVQLSGLATLNQSIALNNGWNIFSFYVEPPVINMKTIVQPLIDAGYLVKVQDEAGAAIEYVVPIGWVNNIGNWKPTEGYKIKVNTNTQINVTGTPIVNPYGIDLITGWNIISYPVSTSQNALGAVNPLITRGTLVKVQNELGLAIENVFPIGWIDNIITFTPGEGYKVNVNASELLVIAKQSVKSHVSASLSTQYSSETVHFKTNWQGNGNDQMNVYITNTEFNNSVLSHGDEIAVFDGDLCVGKSLVKDPTELISITASKDDPTTIKLDGFIEGHPISFKIWKSGIEKEIKEGEVLYATGYSGKYEAMGTTVASLSKALYIDSNTIGSEISATLYPNPFNKEITIGIQVNKAMELRISFYNLLGEKVYTKLVNTNIGANTVKWNGTNIKGKQVNWGVYFLKITSNDLIYNKTFKLIKY